MERDIDAALDALLEPIEGAGISETPRRERVAEWRPGVVWSGDDGTVTTAPLNGDRQPDWDDVLRVWELDPERYAIVEPVLFNAWDALAPGGVVTRMRQWKARVVLRRPHAVPDWDGVLQDMMKFKPARKEPPSGDGIFCVVLGDWQIGKPDGDGLTGTVGRILQATADVNERVKELRRIGRPLGSLYVFWTGDSVEGCVGHYAMQTFGVEIDRRKQVQVARRLLRDALISWSRLFSEVVVLAVGGNHGENRQSSGKAFTTFGDNDDLAVVEQVSEMLAMNGEAFGHVRVVIPSDHLTVTAQAGPWIVGLTHGHVARDSGGVEARLRRWYEHQAGGKRPIGDSDILVTGHYHHLRVADWGGCLWLQAPAMDGGSEWWTAMKGEASQAGLLTFGIYPDRRVADMELL